MKYFLGSIVALLTLAASLLSILAVWGIFPFTAEMLIKFLLTLFIVLVTFALMALCVNVFFKKEKYSEKGNNAHLMDWDK